MGKKRIAFLIIVIIGIGAYLWLRSINDSNETVGRSFVPLLSSTDTAGYKKATSANAIEFPKDLGAHDEYQTEWWYYTGIVATEENRQFGFQLTFFRRAIKPQSKVTTTCLDASLDEASTTAPPCPELSKWRTNQLYLAHFTISDIDTDTFYDFERFSRGAVGLAGAQSEPYRVWLEDWQAAKGEDGRVRLQANDGEIILDLILVETLSPILHGNGGLSVKGSEPGNASYYYSLVQQEAVGTIALPEGQFEVTGLAWKDHEYSTSALSPTAAGWDWFSIQLDNGSALMFFQIRNQDGQLEPNSSGTFIYPDGSTDTLAVDDWRLEVLGTWTSPTSGISYPTGWRIEIPMLDLILTGQPLMADQELNVSTIYWEGATAFEGQLTGEPISGQGYVELTGYGESLSGRG